MLSNDTEIYILYYGTLNSKDGSNTHIIELAKNMANKVPLKLFVMNSKRHDFDENYIYWVPVLHVKNFTNISYEIFLFFTMLRFMLQKKPHIVYIRQDSISFLPLILCKLIGIPSVVEVNGLINDEIDIVSKFSIKKVFLSLSIASASFNCKHCNRIITVTQNIKEELTKSYNIPGSKIHVINNGANIDLFRPMTTQKAKRELNLDVCKSHVCFVGNLAPWQGVEYLIQASPNILEKEPDTTFLIVGDGILKEKLITLADSLNVSRNYIFTGSVPYGQVSMYINACEVCVVPKRPLKSGYSPLKLYEYMACGKPVIASRVDGFEVLEQINSGLLVNPEDPKEFSTAILQLLSDPYLREKMGFNGRNYVQKSQSWKAVSEKVLDIFEDLLNIRLQKKLL